jgi:hypothetical protein
MSLPEKITAPIRGITALARGMTMTLARGITIACLAGAAAAAATTTGCRAVKPYQRIYLNDANMRLGKADIEKMDESVHTYREAASGGGNGKASGGCGCN